MVLGLVLYETADLLCTVFSLTVNCVKGATAFGRWWWPAKTKSDDDGCGAVENLSPLLGPTAHSYQALLDRVRRLEGRVAELEGKGVVEEVGVVLTIRGEDRGDDFEVIDLHTKPKQS